jgi:hypothetical protein
VPKATPPSPPRNELDEVERALSTLAGRHPGHEKARRQTQAAAEQRGTELQRELADRARRRRRRAIVVAANVLALVAAGWVGLKLAVRTHTLRATLEETERPWTSRGFAQIASNVWAVGRSLEANLPGSSCFVAVASVDGVVRVRASATTFEGTRSTAWCACAPDRIRVDGPPAVDSVGLAVLRIDARSLGGPLARSWSGFAGGEWIEGGRECAGALLDAWIADGRWPRPALDQTWLDTTPQRASLRRWGFRVVSEVQGSHPFGVAEGAAGDCLLAVSGAEESLSLRATGGAWLVSHARSGLEWCSSTAARMTVWREGTSPLVVLAVPAARVGGLLGTRECSEAVGLRLEPGAAWLGDEDLTWDAGTLLRSSGLSDIVESPLPRQPGPPIPGVAALALSTGASVATEPTGLVLACDPPLATQGLRRSLCAHAAPVAWWRTGDAPASEARAPLPFWLSPLEPRHEPDAVARIPELLALARRLAREGFEPTMLEGVTELASGVRIVGRADEDAIVAIGLCPRPPWTFPYTDGVPWDLGDPPRVVELKPGATVTLAASPPPTTPVDKRRTVVFRHVSRP